MAELTVFEVTKIVRDEEPLNPSSRVIFQDENLDITSGEPTDYYMDEDNNIVLGPIPDASETLTAMVHVAPSDEATLLPDALYTWRKAIAAGARIWIRENYNEWVDDNEQLKDQDIFEKAVINAVSRRDRGRGRVRLRAKSYFS
jgi:hypothetical protein